MPAYLHPHLHAVLLLTTTLTSEITQVAQFFTVIRHMQSHKHTVHCIFNSIHIMCCVQLDKESYALLQLVLPLTILGRWWMPKEGLTSKAFSGLLQVALAMAFDIAEFTHLVVDEPELHKDRTLLIVVLTFTSTSVFLLVQIDVGMASDNTVNEIAWTTLTILFLDGPFFALRVYIASEYSTQDLQLVFLLKNLFGIIFGGYRVISLCGGEDKESNKNEDEMIGKSKNVAVSESHLHIVHLPDDYVAEMYVNRGATNTNSGGKENTENDLNDNGSVSNSQISHDGAVVIPNVAASSQVYDGSRVTSDEAASLHDDGGLLISSKAAMSTGNQTSRFTHSDIQKDQQEVTNNEDAHGKQNGDNSDVRETEDQDENAKSGSAQDKKATADNDRETSSLSAIQVKHHKVSDSEDKDVKKTDTDNTEIVNLQEAATIGH